MVNNIGSLTNIGSSNNTQQKHKLCDVVEMMIAEMVYVHGAVCVQMQPNLFDVVGSCVLMLGHPFQFDSRSSMHIRGLTKQTHITGTSCQSIRSTQAKGSEGVRVQFGFDLFSYAYGIGWAIHCQSDVWP